jgi:mono/diheme cytochrome c family protein
MKTLGKLIAAGIFVFATLQLIRPAIPVKPETAKVAVPPDVQKILEKNCYSCHSNQRRLSWFDEIVPGYWLVRHDIVTAREHLNFSTLGSKPAGAQKAALFEAANFMQLGAMPLPAFVALHPEAKVSPQEMATFEAYLAPWNSASAAHSLPAGAFAPDALTKALPEHNGLPLDAAFVNWKVMSTTDRGDNNTFRFILGNDVAVQAARTGNISPWPNGTRFAKIAWQQKTGEDGLVYPGAFVQVELMVKDAEKYKKTEGWNWGRWRGVDLKPYGKDAEFVQECTSCHLPVKGNDYVYSLPMTEAKVPGKDVVNNSAAQLPESLPDNPLRWNAITMYVDPKTHTTATLYGNDAAMQAIRAYRAHSWTHPAGITLALVTWFQREDPHWFGARIPATPVLVEFVAVDGAEQGSPSAGPPPIEDYGPLGYRRFAGTGLTEDRSPAINEQKRASFIAGLDPAILP